MLSKHVQGEILEPIIFHRERDTIEESDFHHLIKNILKICPTEKEKQHRLIGVAIRIIEKDIQIPPHQRPPGAPGSKPRKEHD